MQTSHILSPSIERETYRLETNQSWEELKNSGLCLDASEVEAWIATWGTDGELPAPACCKPNMPFYLTWARGNFTSSEKSE